MEDRLSSKYDEERIYRIVLLKISKIFPHIQMVIAGILEYLIICSNIISGVMELVVGRAVL